MAVVKHCSDFEILQKETAKELEDCKKKQTELEVRRTECLRRWQKVALEVHKFRWGVPQGRTALIWFIDDNILRRDSGSDHHSVSVCAFSLTSL